MLESSQEKVRFPQGNPYKVFVMVKVATKKPVMAYSRPKGKTRAKLIGKAVIWVFIMGLMAAPSLLYNQAGIGFSPIMSGSMSPSANVGDVSLTKFVKGSSLRVGDIITVYNQVAGTFYTHRIAEMTTVNSAFRIVTKGDANPTIDQDPLLISPVDEISRQFFVVPPLIGRPLVYIWSFQGDQTSTIFLVVTNVLVIFFLIFRKKIKANFGNERVYKELYSDERSTSEHYRNLVNHLKEIEMEKNLTADENNLNSEKSLIKEER